MLVSASERHHAHRLHVPCARAPSRFRCARLVAQSPNGIPRLRTTFADAAHRKRCIIIIAIAGVWRVAGRVCPVAFLGGRLIAEWQSQRSAQRPRQRRRRPAGRCSAGAAPRRRRAAGTGRNALLVQSFRVAQLPAASSFDKGTHAYDVRCSGVDRTV